MALDDREPCPAPPGQSRIHRAAALGTLGLLLLFLTACSAPPPPPLPPGPIPEYDALFDRESGWTGGDGAYSVPLGGGRTLWLFGDTFLDRYGPKPKMINNSIAIQRGMQIEFYWGKEDKAWFVPPDGKGWFWPGAGIRTEAGLFVFLHHIDRAGKPGIWDFKGIGTWLARVTNPDEPPAAWKVEYSRLPWFSSGENGSRFWGVAVLSAGETTYVYGVDEDWKKGFGGRALTVARVPAARLSDLTAWEFLSGDGWKSSPDAPKRLCEAVGAELSVSRLPSGRYALVTTDCGLSPSIRLRTAPDPTGPWSEAQEVFRCPEPEWDANFFCYAGKAHPELASGEELIVTYACNSKDFGQLVKERRIYRPRFIRVRMPPQRDPKIGGSAPRPAVARLPRSALRASTRRECAQLRNCTNAHIRKCTIAHENMLCSRPWGRMGCTVVRVLPTIWRPPSYLERLACARCRNWTTVRAASHASSGSPPDG